MYLTDGSSWEKGAFVNIFFVQFLSWKAAAKDFFQIPIWLGWFFIVLGFWLARHTKYQRLGNGAGTPAGSHYPPTTIVPTPWTSWVGRAEVLIVEGWPSWPLGYDPPLTLIVPTPWWLAGVVLSCRSCVRRPAVGVEAAPAVVPTTSFPTPWWHAAVFLKSSRGLIFA